MLFQNYTFYHPLFMDWRGRIYTNSNVLSFQSSELSRSLILFKDGVNLNEKGIESLQIYLANCFGLNKKSFNDRVQWTIDNHNNIINCKENKIWLQAKEPFLFLSASFEYKNFHEDKSGNYISRLPIYIDATCNGLQHLAAMTNDINLAKYVNLLKSNNNDIPNDIYNEMANKVNINIKDLIDNNKDGKDFIKLTQLNINRSFINRGIMTIS
jgi:DNA-directed RNA polymerase